MVNEKKNKEKKNKEMVTAAESIFFNPRMSRSFRNTNQLLGSLFADYEPRHIKRILKDTDFPDGAQEVLQKVIDDYLSKRYKKMVSKNPKIKEMATAVESVFSSNVKPGKNMDERLQFLYVDYEPAAILSIINYIQLPDEKKDAIQNAIEKYLLTRQPTEKSNAAIAALGGRRKTRRNRKGKKAQKKTHKGKKSQKGGKKHGKKHGKKTRRHSRK